MVDQEMKIERRMTLIKKKMIGLVRIKNFARILGKYPILFLKKC